MSTKRIAFIVPDLGDGGLFQFYNQLLPTLAEEIDVHVIFASIFHCGTLPSMPGVTCHIVPGDGINRLLSGYINGPLAVAPGLLRALCMAHLAWKMALELKPDVIEVCDWPLGMVPAVLDTSVPSVVQCHGSMAQISVQDPQPGGAVAAMLLNLIEPQVLAIAQEVQTYSHANADAVATATGRTVQMIRPSFALDNIISTNISESHSISIFGRLQSWKGPHILCAALELLGKRAPICDWYGSSKPWQGSSIQADAYLATAYPDVWGKTLRFNAPVNRNEVKRLQLASCCAIVPSTWDVFNFTAVEAMARSRPVIVSSGAGASELIEDGLNGYLFENGNAASLANAIDRMLKLTPAQSISMGDAARETVRLELDPERIAATRLMAYGEVIARHAAESPRPVPPSLSDLLSPYGHKDFDMPSFLNTLPAKPMAKALAQRAYERIVRFGSRT